MKKDALVSPCGNYRYWLLREWDAQRECLNCVLLNPSTADATSDDATIRRLIGFAKRKGYGGIRVFNLFAYRASRPLVLDQVSDPIGPENNEWLRRLTGTVLCAWGNTRWEYRAKFVRKLLLEQGCDLVCLAKNLLGQPKHPVRLPYEDATWQKF